MFGLSRCADAQERGWGCNALSVSALIGAATRSATSPVGVAFLSSRSENWSAAKCQATWWAREDSNLQPDRYERPALTIELRAPAAAVCRGSSHTMPRTTRQCDPRGGLQGRRGTRPACMGLAMRVRVLFVARWRLSYA